MIKITEVINKQRLSVALNRRVLGLAPRVLAALIVASFVPGMPIPVWAADDAGAAAPASYPAADQAPRQQLKEVVVTAQKVQQTLEQVPASVSSLDGDFIRKSGVDSYDELQNYTANTNLQISPSSTQLLIRGFGTLNTVPGLDSSVGVVVDGVVYTYPEYITAFFSDFDHYEVLRGPQGTLFGKNVTAGLLNITTNAPEQKNYVQSEVDARSYGNVAARPVANFALSDAAALRLTGNFEHGDRGALYNTDLNRPERNPTQDSGRMRLRYQLEGGENHGGWTVDLGAFMAHHEQNFNMQQLFVVSPQMTALAKRYDPNFTATIDDQTSENVLAKEKATTQGLSLTATGDMGHPLGMNSLKFTSVTGFAQNKIGARDLDADFSPIPFIQDSLVQPETERQLTQEVRFSGSAPTLFGWGHTVSFVAGLYYDNYTLNTSDNFQITDLGAAASYILAASGLNGNRAGQVGNGVNWILNALDQARGEPVVGPQYIHSGLHQRTKDYAGFGQGEWFMTTRWALIAGLRYAKEDRNGDPYSFSSSPIIQAVAGQENFNYSLHRAEVDFSPKAGFKYQAGKHTELYFTWAEAYKSGGFNSIPLNPQSIEFFPEKATNLEAGFKIKDHLLGGPIRGSISVFHTHFSNLQVSTFEGTSVVIVNAAAAHSMGFESDVMWLLPIRGLSLYSSFGYADARYTSYPNGPAPITSDFGPVPYQNLSGRPLPFAPDWTAAMTPAYKIFNLTGHTSVSAGVDVLFQGSRYLNPEDDPHELQAATLQINPRLIAEDEANGAWGMTLGIQNLTNQQINDQVIDQPLAPGDFAAIRSDRGRFYTGNVYFRFN